MHIHILGICGTFMGSLAQLAKAMGHEVSGCDSNVYPPMSTQLENAGITLTEGYDPAQLHPAPDLVVIGNALSRGNPAVEYVLDNGIPYTSGPQWLGDHCLRDRWVLVWRAPTVKPPPPVCWRGSWSTRVCSPDF
jgi:UDP-N-acetylmuramate: L-alanyl-gamma-D-glutamyl-meso-diaminopimelate ligase